MTTQPKWAALIELDGHQIVFRLVENTDDPEQSPYLLHQEVTLACAHVDEVLGFATIEDARENLEAADELAVEFIKGLRDDWGALFDMEAA